MERGESDFTKTHPRVKQYNLFQKASTSQQWAAPPSKSMVEA